MECDDPTQVLRAGPGSAQRDRSLTTSGRCGGALGAVYAAGANRRQAVRRCRVVAFGVPYIIRNSSALCDPSRYAPTPERESVPNFHRAQPFAPPRSRIHAPRRNTYLRHRAFHAVVNRGYPPITQGSMRTSKHVGV